jgi:hypothetical protein
MGTLLGGGLSTETPPGAYKVQWWLIFFLMHFSPVGAHKPCHGGCFMLEL